MFGSIRFVLRHKTIILFLYLFIGLLLFVIIRYTLIFINQLLYLLIFFLQHKYLLLNNSLLAIILWFKYFYFILEWPYYILIPRFHILKLLANTLIFLFNIAKLQLIIYIMFQLIIIINLWLFMQHFFNIVIYWCDTFVEIIYFLITADFILGFWP